MTIATLRTRPIWTSNLRERMSLDGIWNFKLEGRGGWRKTIVPNPWQAEFPDLREQCGVAFYERDIALPESWLNRNIVIHFGAVSYLAEVFFNGQAIGVNEGGYLPFEFLLPQELLTGKNRLQVKVTLPDGDDRTYPEFPFAEIPHGKQSWYGPLGGIWQSVYIEARDARCVASCRVRADLGSGEVALKVDLSGRVSALLYAEISTADGSIVATAEGIASGGSSALTAVVPNVQPWSPESPHLYRVTLRLEINSDAVDTVIETFGFRSFESRDGHFFLNGEPFYMRGALDQDYYPDGICTPPSMEFLDDQLRKAKALGLNTLRCHIKAPDPRYYEAADRLGMLIWTEIPNVETFSERSSRRLRETLEGILARDGNHPSIVVWTIINEDWGMRLREVGLHRQWLAETFDWLKQADPTRLVVDNSPCAPNYHIKTDINDYHYYRSIPERRSEWDQITKEFAGGADWTFSPHGDAVRSGDEPLVISEFGVWGLPHLKALRATDGTDPWWFSGGHLWSDGAAGLLGVEQRFSALRLERVFGSFDAFIEATQWYQFENLKYEIESMRAHQSIAGYVVTEFTDVHWEANGLMDMARNFRIFHKRFAEINADIVILPGLQRWAYWAGEEIALTPNIAAGGKSVPAGSVLEWSMLDKGGHVSVPAIAPLRVEPSAVLKVTIPPLDKAAMVDVHFRLLGPNGSVLAVNRAHIAVHPQNVPKTATVSSNDPGLAERLAALGYAIAAEKDADVFVTRELDAGRVEAIRLGQRVLLLAESGNGSLRHGPPPREQPHVPIVDDIPGIPSQPYFSFPGYGLSNRDGTVWRGDWVTNFSWLRRSGPFADLPGGPLLDLTFDRVVPRAVITGFRPWEFDGRVHGAIVVGWVQKPVATIIEKTLGPGKMVATTFRLTEDAPGCDPTATVLFDCLLRLAVH